MSARETQKPQKSKPKRRHPWLRRVGYTLLALVVIFLIFHRPILTGLIHLVAVKVAAKQHITLSLDVGGTVLTNLSLKNISALPKGDAPSPVERIKIQEVSVHYSIVSLIRRGVSEFLQSYTLRNADIEVKPVEGTHEQKSDLASTLHGLIQQPALFSDRVTVENLNLVAHTPDGEFALKDVNILLDPVATGWLKIGRLQIPKIRTWENLTATSTYAKRDLILRGLTIDPEIVLNEVELDASRRAEGINRLYVAGALFGGRADFSLETHELKNEKKKNSSATNSDRKQRVIAAVTSSIQNLSLEKLGQYFKMSVPPIGSVSDSTLHFSGDPDVPATWTGAMNSSVENVNAGGMKIDNARVRLEAKNGGAVFDTEVNSGRNRVALSANCKLPQRTDEFAKTDLDGRLEINADELGRFAAAITSGSVTGGGPLSLKNKIFTAALTVSAKEVAAENFRVGSADVKLDATKSLAAPADSQEPAAPFDGLKTHVDATIADVRAANYALDSGTLALSTDNERVRLGTLELRRTQNTVTASGDVVLPRDMKSWTTAPANVRFEIAAPSIAAFNAEPDLNAPNARLEANGELTNGAAGANGKITLLATGITFREFSADKLSLDVGIADNTATIHSLMFALNATDGLTASGHVGLQKPFVYDATVQARVRDLAKFNSFVPDMQGGLGGSLALDWSGSGNIDQLQNSGEARLRLDGGKAAGVSAINAEIAGAYSPEFINVPTFRIDTSKGDIALKIGMGNNAVKVSDIAVKLGGKPVLTGFITLPLDLRTPKEPGTIIPTNGPVEASLKTSEINLDALPTLEGSKDATPKQPAKKTAKKAPEASGPPVRGIVSATLTAGGTLDAPDARLQIAARGIQAKAAAKLAPANAEADLRLVADQLSLKARIQQPAIQPVEIAGTLPLPVKQIIEEKKIDENSPVQLSIRLPRSSVAFLTQVVPALRFAQGTVAVNVDVGGTIAQPTFTGSTLIDMPAIRFTNTDMPSISGFRGDMRFAGNQLTVNRLGGDISGGSVNLTGRIEFPKITEPVFDLRLVSNGALLMRNEALTVRADSDVRVTGPLAGATVAGNVGITRSKFFKEIEILPIELPGRPAPKPPETAKGVSLPPPLADWKFDVKIRTKDPFSIRGNLANGAALVDLALVGEGRALALDGTVRIENFVASLPFSKLQVNNGLVYFSPDEPFTPKLDIQATSTMQDYRIGVYIYGTADDPKTIFSSEPPLPQEDIIALLATGATASQLTGAGGGEALAGKAASLLFQQLYHKVFKTKAPSENESFLSRFKVDVGGVDPRSGQQEVTTRFKLSDSLYLVGDLDVGGNIRGQVKYLLRFR